MSRHSQYVATSIMEAPGYVENPLLGHRLSVPAVNTPEHSISEDLKRNIFSHTMSFVLSIVNPSPLFVECGQIVKMVLDLRLTDNTLSEAFGAIYVIQDVARTMKSLFYGSPDERNRLFTALQDDSVQIVGALERFTDLSSASFTITSLRGDTAQKVLGLFFTVLHDREIFGAFQHVNPRWSRFRKRLRRLAVRLVEFSLVFPPEFVLNIAHFSPPFGRQNSAGSYATVELRMWRGFGSSRDTLVAFKVFHPFWRVQSQFEHVLRYEQDKSLYKEIALCAYLNHPNICPVLGVIFTSCDSLPTLVLPWMRKGNVTDYLVNEQDLQSCINMAKDIACGVAYLHAEGIVHCDLHPGNVLINDEGRAQITDLGLSNFADSTTATATLRRTGAARYRAPEIHVAAREEDHIRHTRASDIFSLGMVIWHIFSGRHPFPSGMAAERVATLIIRNETPGLDTEIPEELRGIFRACCALAPGDRPGAEEVVSSLEALASLVSCNL